jgi:hypothetical protein
LNVAAKPFDFSADKLRAWILRGRLIEAGSSPFELDAETARRVAARAPPFGQRPSPAT